MPWRTRATSREDDWWEAGVVAIPLPLLWMIDRWLLEQQGWSLPAVLLFFFTAWAILGWVALRIYRALRRT